MRLRATTLAQSLALFSVGMMLISPVAFTADFPYFRKATAVERLAKKIDELRKHIDEYGSVVAKHPDIWGESRLMQHRDEFEREMAKEVGEFKFTLNAQVRASDQAFLTTAQLIEATLTGSSKPNSSGGGEKEESTTTSPPQSSVRNSFFNFSTPGEKDDKSPPIKREDPISASGKFNSNGGDATAVALEPVILLDQKARYLNHLHELRRINEGDDVGDSPGYSLDLVRIPVSINPGKKTSEGYGAEITLSATPLFGVSTLPTTIQRWVINDLVHEMSLKVTQVLNNPDLRDKSRIALFSLMIDTLDTVEPQGSTQKGLPWNYSDWYKWHGSAETTLTSACPTCDPMAAQPSLQDFIQSIYRRGLPEEISKDSNGDNDVTKGEASSGEAANDGTPLAVPVPAPDPEISWLQKSRYSAFVEGVNDYLSFQKSVADALEELRELRNLSGGPTVSRTRNGQIPLPLEQYSEVYGQGLLLRALWEAYVRAGTKDRFDKHIHFQDVEAYVKNEIDSAYEALLLKENMGLWTLCNHDLVTAIRNRDVCAVACIRQKFMDQLSYNGARCTLAAYGWAIIVEAALLNERLIRDMNETARLKGGNFLVDEYTMMTHPYPTTTACNAFNDYVQCRWPVYVFALDPVSQQQNVGNTFSRRREFQLALAVALATGQVKAENVTRFARRLELDVQTIDLNRTIVGFSHGDDTFGWRFYPRVQTPPVESNLTVGLRDLLVGGPRRKDDLKRERLEPGMRECTALVIRPSFLSTIMFDSTSNWFELADPGDVELDIRDTIKLSRSVRELENLSQQCVDDAHNYRKGEVYRLTRHVDQLSAELPLQTLTTSIPVENALGGFRIFAAGASGLAPQLYTWYGQPGIKTGKTTSLFLVGDNFSVKGTRVVAGGHFLSADSPAPTPSKSEGEKEESSQPQGTTSIPVELLSRRIMRVTIPAGVETVQGHDAENHLIRYVDVHVATPYGVTQHLHIPVEPEDAADDAVKKKEAEEKTTESKALSEKIDKANEAFKDLDGKIKAVTDASTKAAASAAKAEMAEKNAEINVEKAVEMQKLTLALAIETEKKSADAVRTLKSEAASVVARANPAQFRWKTVPQSLTAEIVYHKDGKATGFALGEKTGKTAVVLTQSGDAPGILGPRKKEEGADLAFWIHLVGKDAGKPRRVPVGTFAVKVDEPIQLDSFETEIEKALLKTVDADFGLTSLKLTSYVRFPNDDLPVLRLENEISVQVSSPAAAAQKE